MEMKKLVTEYRLIDDVFFEVFAKDLLACQEILRTILEDQELVVKEVIVQSDERNLFGRSVRLDALCTLGDGSLCNIEIQRSDNDDHLRRARFNAASITVKNSSTGTDFRDVTDVYVVYISETDILKGGLTIYHIDNVIRENGVVVDDGLHEIFVNAAVKDGTDISDLMSCFVQKDVNNPKFPEVTRRFQELKNTEGGLNSMCDIMEKYMKEGVEKARAEARAEAIAEARAEAIETAAKTARWLFGSGQTFAFVREGIPMETISDDELRDIQNEVQKTENK